MCSSVKSKVKYKNELSQSFDCSLGVRQGECLSPFLFAMFLNDIGNVFVKNGISSIDVNTFKIFLILYADDIVIFAPNAKELRNSLNALYNYCYKWKLKINTSKTKMLVFKKGGRLPVNLNFYYGNDVLEIVNKFVYLGIVFTPGGSFSEAQYTLSGQAMKAMYSLDKCLCKFTGLKTSHYLKLRIIWNFLIN